MVICTLLAGPWAERGGPLVVMRVGVAAVVAGFVVFQYGADKRTLLGAATAMGVMTAGVGFFMPAAFLYARSLVSRRRLMRYIGIYSAMLQLPLLLSPMLAEYVFARWGRQDFFYLVSAPVVVGLLLLLLAGVPDGAESRTPSHDQHNSFLQVLREGLPWEPYATGITAAVLFGAVNAFGSLALIQRGLPTAYFFGSFAVGFVVMRFGVMPFLDGFPKRTVACAGLLLMLAGVATATPASTLTVALGGCLFGFGYSVCYPLCSVWISEAFDDTEQARPLAIFNALFVFGVHASPLAAGMLVQFFGVSGLFVAILIGGGVCTVGLCISSLWSRPVVASRESSHFEGRTD